MSALLDIARRLAQWPRLPVLPLAWMGVIFFLSGIRGRPEEIETLPEAMLAWVTPSMQNLLHVPVYGALAAFWALWLAPRLSHRVTAAWAWALTAGYGLTDEFHQSFVPGRYPSATDVLSDAIGAACGVAVCLLWLRRCESRKAFQRE